MKRITGYLRWLVPTAVIVGLVPLGGAIASANDAPAQGGSATLNASGATFPQPYYESVIGAFKQKNSNVTINYAGGGSGKGRQDFADQVVDFAGSDAPYSAADAANVKGGTFFYFPTVAAPITVSYNLSGVKKLQLSADTLAKIFQGDIKTWNDAAIKADNPARSSRPPRSRWRTAPTAREPRRTSPVFSRRRHRPRGRSAPARRSAGRRTSKQARATLVSARS